MARDPADHLTATRASGDLAQRLGDRMRRRRLALSRTLAAVSEEAEISVSYLSAIEQGVHVPSLPVLVRVVHALRLTVHELLKDEEQRDVRVGAIRTDRAGGEVLSHPALRLRVSSVVAEPGETGDAPFRVAGAAVFVFVEKGALLVDVDGAQYALGQGDALDALDVATMRWQSLGEITSVSLWGAALAHLASGRPNEPRDDPVPTGIRLVGE